MTVQQLFRKPGTWTQQVYARSKGGRSVSPEGKSAVCFCMLGAIDRCYPAYSGVPQALDTRMSRLVAQSRVRQVLQNLYGTTHITNWNDTKGRKVSEIRRVVRLAGI